MNTTTLKTDSATTITWSGAAAKTIGLMDACEINGKYVILGNAGENMATPVGQVQPVNVANDVIWSIDDLETEIGIDKFDFHEFIGLQRAWR